MRQIAQIAWPVNGDAVGQDAGVLGRAAGERDALVQPEQAGRPCAVLDGHRDIAHELAEFLGQPVQRGADHFLETAGIDLDHLAHCPAQRCRATQPRAGLRRRGTRECGPYGLLSCLCLGSDRQPGKSRSGLGEVAGTRAGGFSLGMGQRLGVAAALLAPAPQTAALDDPVNGPAPWTGCAGIYGCCFRPPGRLGRTRSPALTRSSGPTLAGRAGDHHLAGG